MTERRTVVLKNNKSVRVLIISMITALLMMGMVVSASAATVKLNKKQVTITKGFTYKLKVTGTRKKITWNSKNKAIATVSKTGLVKAKKKGNTVITAKISGEKTLKCTVKVVNNVFKGTPTPGTVSPDGKNITLYVKQLQYVGNKLKVTGFFTNGTGHDVHRLKDYRIQIIGETAKGKVKLADGMFNMAVDISYTGYQNTNLIFNETEVMLPKKDLCSLESCIVRENGTIY